MSVRHSRIFWMTVRLGEEVDLRVRRNRASENIEIYSDVERLRQVSM